MSLTSFVNEKDVRERLKQDFPKPRMMKNKNLLAPPLTSNYRLVGTAFDYLMRFYIKSLNPQAIERSWIAEALIQTFKTKGLNSLYQQGYLLVTQARENFDSFLKTHQLTDELIQSSLFLAKLDGVYRSGKIEENFQVIESEDISDLRNLMKLIEANHFKSSGTVLLNPTFGLASNLVGGADADLVVDDMLIDIKTVKEFDLSRETFNQLIGYYTLSKIDQINGAPPQHFIKRLGIYFSRYAYLHVIPVEEVIDERLFPQFLEWFVKRARQRGSSVNL
jgi:hypothetical protein